MFSVNFAKRMRNYTNMYSSFDFPVILADKNYNYFWSNLESKKTFVYQDNKINIHAMLGELNLETVNTTLLKNGFYIASDIIPFSDFQINVYPIFYSDTDEIDGVVLMFFEQSNLKANYHTDYISKTSDVLSNNIRDILHNIFFTSDTISLKADLLGADWVSSHLNFIGLSCYQILRLADNVYTYSKLQNQQITLQKSLFDLTAWIQTIEPLIQSLADFSGITVNFDIPDSTIYLPLDENLFQAAFFNILHNSMYYTSPDNEIDITIKENIDSVNVIIEDRGIGISEEMLASIFKPYKADSMPDKSPGIGLGLTVASRIVNMHDGTLEITSSEDEGTTATITLPSGLFSDTLPLRQYSDDELLSKHRLLDDKFSPLHVGLTSALLSPYTKGDRKL